MPTIVPNTISAGIAGMLCPKSFQLRDQPLPFLDRLQPPPQHSDHEALVLRLPPRSAAPTQVLQLPVRIRNSMFLVPYWLQWASDRYYCAADKRV
jgi:hypothetical protein